MVRWIMYNIVWPIQDRWFDRMMLEARRRAMGYVEIFKKSDNI